MSLLRDDIQTLKTEKARWDDEKSELLDIRMKVKILRVENAELLHRQLVSETKIKELEELRKYKIKARSELLQLQYEVDTLRKDQNRWRADHVIAAQAKDELDQLRSAKVDWQSKEKELDLLREELKIRQFEQSSSLDTISEEFKPASKAIRFPTPSKYRASPDRGFRISNAIRQALLSM